MEVFVSAPSFKLSNLAFPDGSVVRDVLNRFVQQQGVSSGDLYVIRNGRRSGLDDPLLHGAVYHLEARLCGGKGGFGSMLRALGAQIEKTTNREACRDLSGRRLRDVNHEKEMAEWLKKQAEREVEKEQRRLERLQRKLSEPKHQFTDPEYQQQCHDLSERLEDSVVRGLQVSSVGQVRADEASPAKRPNSDQSEQPLRKKRAAAGGCFWMGMDELLSSEDEDEESPSTSCSCGVTAVTMAAETEEAEPGEISSSSLAPQTVKPEEEGRRSAEDGRRAAEKGRGLVEKGCSSADDGGVLMKECSSAEEGRGLVEEGCSSAEEGRGLVEKGCSSAEEGRGLVEEGCSSAEEGRGLVEEGCSSADEGRVLMKECSLAEEGCSSAEEGRGLVEEGCSSADEGRVLMKEGCSSAEEEQGLVEEGQRPTEASRDHPDGLTEDPGALKTSEGGALLDLSSLSSIHQLESLGLDILKQDLMARGLKCGGTLKERATRLFSIRGLEPDQIDPVLRARPAKTRRK